MRVYFQLLPELYQRAMHEVHQRVAERQLQVDREKQRRGSRFVSHILKFIIWYIVLFNLIN